MRNEPYLTIRDRLLRLEIAAVESGESPEADDQPDDRTVKLQQYCDDDFDSFREALLSQFSSYPTAQRWVDSVGDDWFNALLFSDTLVQTLASSMIDCVRQYISSQNIPDTWWNRAERNRA